MQNLNFYKNGLKLAFAIDDESRLCILGINNENETANRFFVPVEISITGENPNDHHGGKHTGSMGTENLQYISHTETENELVFLLKNEKIQVNLHYCFYPAIQVVRSYAEIQNISDEALGLEYASSFCLYQFPIEHILLCHNAWCRELEWRKYKPEDLGYNHITDFSTKRIAVSNTGTWSTKEYMPMGMIENQNTTIFWQIEHNGSWNFEISDIQNTNYLKLSGPSEQENGWWKELKPGETFETVKAAVVFAKDFNEAVGEMTKYRRKIAFKNPSDKKLPVIFNDYMDCLWADPTTEKELPMIDIAAKCGAEIYCMDAGWYADGSWWETVGEWKVCEKRFKNGMKEVFDAIHAKGMKAGIWIEPEVMGIHCPILNQFDDTCFFMRHGKRVIDHGRYHFDFRNPKVTNFLDKVVDGLIQDYGIEYLKFDYNIDGGVGTEVNSSSFGDGLMQHQAAYLEWIDRIYDRHPKVIIENCGSGGMRMDYKTLSHFSLQSMSDATNYSPTSVIGAMSGTAVIPEQAEIWVLPKATHTDGEIAFSVINALFNRMEISGETHLLNEKQFAILKDGIDLYKSMRDEIPALLPYYPADLIHFESDWVIYGCKNEKKCYLCAGRRKGQRKICLDFKQKIQNITCIYPRESTINFRTDGNNLLLSANEITAAVFEIIL